MGLVRVAVEELPGKPVDQLGEPQALIATGFLHVLVLQQCLGQQAWQLILRPSMALLELHELCDGGQVHASVERKPWIFASPAIRDLRG